MSRLPIASALLVSTLPAAAQTTLLSVPTNSPGPAILGPDLDRDGVRDLVVGEPGGGAEGRVTVHSGADGSVLRTWDGEQPGDGYGSSLAVLRDVNGDDVPDLAFGAPLPGAVPGHLPYVHVVSGRSGALLLRLEGSSQDSHYGSALVSLGDVDGDGAGDLAVGVEGTIYPSGGPPSYAEVVSGASGAVLWSTPAAGGGYPVGLARHPDLDGDGGAELVVGLSAEDRVEVRAGATGAVLRTYSAPAGVGFGSGIAFGGAVAAGRDLDGDDVPDLAVGAPYEALSPPCVGCYEGPAHSGAVYVISGASGDVVQRMTATVGEIGLGSTLALIGDANLDGVDDLVTANPVRRSGCCLYFPGTVRAFSAFGSEPFTTLGYGSYGLLADAGDVNGDGLGDFTLGGREVSNWPPPPVFAAEIVASPLPSAIGSYDCMSAPYGCYPFPYASGAPSSSGGGAFQLHSSWPTGTPGLLLLGSGVATTPMGAAGTCLSGVFARLPATLASYPGGPSNACPDVLTSDLPDEVLAGYPPGSTVYAQFVSPGSSGAVTSGVLYFTVWP